MLLIVDEPVECFESAYGYKQTCRRPKLTSALPPTPDISGGMFMGKDSRRHRCAARPGKGRNSSPVR